MVIALRNLSDQSPEMSAGLLRVTWRSCSQKCDPRLFVLCAVTLASCAGQPEGYSEHLIVPSEVDFGSGEPATMVKDVLIRNPTTQPVRITNIVSSCRCAVVDAEPPLVIQAGATQNLRLEFDTTGLVGPVSHTFVLKTDSGSVPFHKIVASAFVEREAAPLISPDVIDIGSFGTWETLDTEIRIIRLGTEELGIKSIECTDANLSMRLLRKEGHDYVYALLVDRKLKSGPFNLTFDIKTTAGQAALNVQGNKQGQVYCKADVIALSRREDGLHGGFTLHHNPEIDVSKCIVSSDLGEVSVRQIIPRSQDESRFEIVVKQMIGGNGRGEITIETPLHGGLYRLGCVVLTPSGISGQQ